MVHSSWYTMNCMKTPTSHKISKYIEDKGQASPNELSEYLRISPRAVFKQLQKLRDSGELSRIGKPPKVYYVQKTKKEINSEDTLQLVGNKIIEKNFVTVTPAGEFLKGTQAFVHWCTARKYNPKQKAKEYKKIMEKYNSIRKRGLINGMKKLKSTFRSIYLDELYYLDFYSIEVFGRTKLGQKLLYAKQSQSRALINDLIDEIRPKIESLVKRNSIDGVLFVPPTVKREVQFMRELEKKLKLNVKTITITKIKTPIAIPQKTLSKLTERIENARSTFVIDDQTKYTNVLIIDDAVGSGATMNELGKMLRKKGTVKNKIIGLAITGSLKGFDVISEV